MFVSIYSYCPAVSKILIFPCNNIHNVDKVSVVLLSTFLTFYAKIPAISYFLGYVVHYYPYRLINGITYFPAFLYCRLSGLYHLYGVFPFFLNLPFTNLKCLFCLLLIPTHKWDKSCYFQPGIFLFYYRPPLLFTFLLYVLFRNPHLFAFRIEPVLTTIR